MRIILADDDPIARALISRSIRRRTTHEVTEASDGQAALDAALGPRPPDMLILDWLMPGLSGPDVCRRIRDMAFQTQPYILLVTGKNGRADVIAALDAGADDLLPKPLAPDLLEARLRLASRRSRTPSSAAERVTAALIDAVSQGDGELVVRDGTNEATARVFFHSGRVAWVHVSGEEGSLTDILAPEFAIDAQTAREVLEECRVSRTRLGDKLIEWGLVDRARLRECLLAWLRKKLESVQRFEQPSTLFLPRSLDYSEDLSFPLDSIISLGEREVPARSLTPRNSVAPRGAWTEAFLQPEVPDAAVDRLLEYCMAGGGFESVAVVDTTTGHCLGTRGEGLSPDNAWASIQHMNVVSSQEVVEANVVSTTGRHHIAMTVAAGQIVYAVAPRPASLLGVAIAALRTAILTHKREAAARPAES